jgi:succinyl-CoA synthetase beta subunit
MHIHEYQGKDVLRKYGVPVPRGHACFSPDEAVDAAARVGGRAWLVKPQVHGGARGNSDAVVRHAWSPDEVRRHAAGLLGTALEAPRPGSAGRVVRRLLVEESLEVAQTFHLRLALDRDSRRVALTAGEGGTSPGDPAPQKLRRLLIDPAAGVRAAEADGLARDIGFSGKLLPRVRTLVQNLYQAFDACDASLAEIDPLVLTRDGRVMALGARFAFDPHALFRQPAIAAMRDLDEEDAVQAQASAHGQSCLARSGEIGGLVNGAGLAMATMDAIRLHGGAPADVLDVGGGASAEKVAEALRLMLRTPRLSAVLVNIFGGLLKCDVVARGLLAALREVELTVPLVVRLKGTNETLGRTLLAQSGLSIIHADDIDEAAGFAVAAALSTPRRAH